jgi:hypothetical protein
MRDGYQATWHQETYEASPAGDEVRLYATRPAEGFEELRPGRYRRVVRTACVWRGQPFIVLAQHEGWLRLEYTGGLAPVAARLGLEEFDYGVYQGWAPAAEVSEVREYRV